MDWKLGAVYLANLLCCLIYDIIAPFYPIEAQAKGVSNFQIGIVFTSMPLTTCLVSPLIGLSLKLMGRRATFTSGTAVMGLAMLCMAVADLFPTLGFFGMSCLARALAGVGSACVFTVCTF
jgi:MFS family permease